MPAINIQCILKRAGGTFVDLPDAQGRAITYHFAPNADDEHVACVDNEAHQAVFLGIPEGYRFHSPALDIFALTKGATAPGTPGVPVPTAAPVDVPATADSAVKPQGSQDETAAGNTDAKTGDGFDPHATLDADALAAWGEANEAALRQMHEAELGTVPRANAKVETMAAKIAAKRAG